MGKVYVSEGDIIGVLIQGREQLFSVHIQHRSDGVQLPFFRERRMCDACQINEGSDYVTDAGKSVCAECVNRVFAFRRAFEVLSNIGDYDVPLARALEYIGEDDNAMANSGKAYVDSHAAAMDATAGLSLSDIREFVQPIADVIVSALCEPGTYGTH